MTNDKPVAYSSATPYDDVYRTLVTDCPNLIIPVVNEVFQKNLPDNAKVIPLENVVFLYQPHSDQPKRITDSNLMIEASRYHIECQSTIDNTMLIRIFEYDSQIALQDSTLMDNTLSVRFPNTAVMYLRHNSTTPDTMTVHIEVPGDECSYEVPVMKTGTYTVDEIFEKKLYFLIPFHIFAYEHLLEECDKNEEKLKQLTCIYEDVINRLHECARKGLISEYVKCTIIDMAKQVLNHISQKYSNVKEGIGEIMGGNVLEYEAKDILRKGIAIGHADGRAEGHAAGHAEGLTERLVMQIRKKLDIDQTPEKIADDLMEPLETIEALIKEHQLA